MKQIKFSPSIKLNKMGGNQFTAFQARQQAFNGLMNPIIGFDYYWLSADVFGPHRHEGMSAISYIFEDSAPFQNKDSMGTDLTITPGSLLWTWAGSGVVHHEFPIVQNKQVHGLQLFVDIAPAKKGLPPQSVFIAKEKMPVLATEGSTVKIAMGSTSDIVNPAITPEPVTLLDVQLKAGKNFSHALPAGWNGTIFVLSGALKLNSANNPVLREYEVIAFGQSNSVETLSITAQENTHILLISGPPVKVGQMALSK